MPIALRTANINDLEILQRWDEDPYVLESDPNDEWNREHELKIVYPWRQMLIAEFDGQPIGFLQIIDPAGEETHYWGEVEPNLRAIDIWIGEEQYRNRGFGTEMMHLAITRCFSDENVAAILLDPLKENEKAHRFYERLGFRFVEERQFNDDLCYVYRLDRVNWKPAWPQS